MITHQLVPPLPTFSESICKWKCVAQFAGTSEALLGYNTVRWDSPFARLYALCMQISWALVGILLLG